MQAVNPLKGEESRVIVSHPGIECTHKNFLNVISKY